MTTLDKIFDVWYGVNLEVVNSEVVEHGIPFVSRQAVDNGVVCHVRKIEGVTPNPAHTLSIAVSGSVLSTFYHDCEYYSGRDVYVAKPKKPMTREEMLYYAVIIEANKYKYNYGRGANKTFRNIIVPEKHELPKYINTYKAEPTFSESSVINKKYEINTQDWKPFILKDIFTISRGKTLTSDDKEYYTGNMPCVNGTSTNNGVLCYLSEDIEKIGFKKQPTPSLSLCRVGTSGLTFVQNKPYYIADNAFCLKLKEQKNIYVYLFISVLLDKECVKYCYGRTISSEKYMQTRIKLPVTPSDEPDWKFMEEYIKSLPYSVNLEINEKAKLLNEIETYKHKVAALETQLAAQHSAEVHYHIDHVDNLNLGDNVENKFS